MTYALGPGLHCCESGGRLVFLDVPADRYFGLDDDGERAFRALLADPAAAPSDQIETLIERGLLRRLSSAPALSIAPPIALPRSSFVEEAQPDAGLGETIRAGIAITRARWCLRRRGFAAALAELEHLKTGIEGGREPAPIAAAFDFAGLFLDSLDQCLPHALALAGTLFRRGCDATFVIAVRRRPFRAHSWVQVGDMLLNDRLDRVRDFVPVLAI